MRKPTRYLLLTVFVSGMTTLGAELSASRLLEPSFGNSQIVWAAIIGLILLYLAVGYELGGRWADRDPRFSTLFQITAWGALLIGIIPFAAAPVLDWAAEGMVRLNAGILVGALVAVLVLFSLPVTLLGTVSPFAIRLALTDIQRGGHTAGSVYALSTLGSLVGTFLPVLVLIPTIGTRLTFVTLALLLLVVSLGGLFLTTPKRGLLYLLMPLVLVGLTIWQANRPIKPTPGQVYETESSYNYIQVVEVPDPEYGTWRLLLLNEGEGIHSAYNPSLPDFPLVDGVWDYFLVAPYFNNPPFTPQDVNSLLVIGSAAGTITKAYSHIYGPIRMDGVEIDPKIVEVGRQWFDMNDPGLTVHVQDGRYFLRQTDARYDVIAVDAYRPPYIPFHLTTREFFQEVADHLTPNGVVAINAGRTATDYSLVNALAATMKTVFPSVYIYDTPDYGSSLGNSLVIATRQPTRMSNFTQNTFGLTEPHLRLVVQRQLSAARYWEYKPAPDDIVFTDDKAPVEQVIHSLIIRYLMGS
ncbi:MAG: spermine synthase [Chloroflexi bacterium]|nr:MAG: spermine synthase [Chloroflexota bacterium]